MIMEDTYVEKEILFIKLNMDGDLKNKERNGLCRTIIIHTVKKVRM